MTISDTPECQRQLVVLNDVYGAGLAREAQERAFMACTATHLPEIPCESCGYDQRRMAPPALSRPSPGDEAWPEPGEHECCLLCGSEQFMLMANGTIRCGWRRCQGTINRVHVAREWTTG